MNTVKHHPLSIVDNSNPFSVLQTDLGEYHVNDIKVGPGTLQDKMYS